MHENVPFKQIGQERSLFSFLSSRCHDLGGVDISFLYILLNESVHLRKVQLHISVGQIVSGARRSQCSHWQSFLLERAAWATDSLGASRTLDLPTRIGSGWLDLPDRKLCLEDPRGSIHPGRKRSLSFLFFQGFLKCLLLTIPSCTLCRFRRELVNTCTMSVVTVGLRASLMYLLISTQQRIAISSAQAIVLQLHFVPRYATRAEGIFYTA